MADFFCQEKGKGAIDLRAESSCEGTRRYDFVDLAARWIGSGSGSGGSGQSDDGGSQ